MHPILKTIFDTDQKWGTSVVSIISKQDVISEQGGQNFFIYYMKKEYSVGQIFFILHEK